MVNIHFWPCGIHDLVCKKSYSLALVIPRGIIDIGQHWFSDGFLPDGNNPLPESMLTSCQEKKAIKKLRNATQCAFLWQHKICINKIQLKIMLHFLYASCFSLGPVSYFWGWHHLRRHHSTKIDCFKVDWSSYYYRWNHGRLPWWQHCCHSTCKICIYRQTFSTRCTCDGNITIVDSSDVVGASPVGVAPTTSSFSTEHLASVVWAKTTASGDEAHIILWIWCFGVAYIRGLTVILL